MSARNFLIQNAAHIVRRDGCKTWEALNIAADALRDCEPGTLGAEALRVFRSETEDDKSYDRLCRAVRGAAK